MSGTLEEPPFAYSDEDGSDDSEIDGPDGTSIGANHGDDNDWDNEEENNWDDDNEDDGKDDEAGDNEDSEEGGRDEEDNTYYNGNEEGGNEDHQDYNDVEGNDDDVEGNDDDEEGGDDDDDVEGNEDQQPAASEQVHRKTQTRTKAGPRAVERSPSSVHESENPIQCVELFVHDEEETGNEEEEDDQEGQLPEFFRTKRNGKRPYTDVTFQTNVARLPPRHNYASESDDDSVDSQVSKRRSGKRMKTTHGNKTSSEEDNSGDWKLPPSTRLWNESYSSLVTHLKEHKEWPDTKTNTQLARWMTDQQQHKMANRRCLTDRREAKLTRLGFSWKARVPHKFVCPIESDIKHIREWMHQYMMLQVHLQEYQYWPTTRSDGGLYEWVWKQQMLLVHGDAPDSIEQYEKQQLDKMGIDWKKAMAGRPFNPTGEYVRLNVRMQKWGR